MIAALPAQAQIKIIHEDGSVTEFNPNPEPAPAPEVKKKKPPAPKPFSPPLVKSKDLKPSWTEENIKIEYVRTPEVKPAPALAAVPPEDAPLDKPIIQRIKATSEPSVPVPAHLPVKRQRKAAVQHEINQAGKITANQAIGIALDNAPPSSDFQVFQAMHEDRPVYAVVFKTDSGPYEILIDGASGEVLAGQKLQDIIPSAGRWPVAR